MRRQKGVSCLRNIFVRGTFLLVLAFSLISCGGSGKRAPQSESAIKAAEASVPGKARKEYDSAIVAMKSGNIPQAKNILSNLTKTYPDLAGPHVNLGIIHFRADEIDKAEAAFEQALKVNPDSAVSLNHLGIINRGKGKFSEAKSNYEKALDIAPNYAYAHLNYGILLDLYLGELDDALDHYQKFQELAPGKDKEVKNWIIDLKRRIKRAKN